MNAKEIVDFIVSFPANVTEAEIIEKVASKFGLDFEIAAAISDPALTLVVPPNSIDRERAEGWVADRMKELEIT